MMNFKIIERLPKVSEYNELRALAGWPTYDSRFVEIALKNTLFSVCIEVDKKAIGMGRVIGDNAIYLHVQDVIVHPDFQRSGAGKLVMNALLNYIDQVAGKNTNIGLMCSKGREKFYESFGFVQRPNEIFGAGMIKITTSGE